MSESETIGALYRERAYLVNVITRLFPSYLAYNDPSFPDWPVLYVDSPEGQLSWHIAPEDLQIFRHVGFIDDIEWDGHTTAEKYERLRRLCYLLPKLTYAHPEYGEP